MKLKRLVGVFVLVGYCTVCASDMDKVPDMDSFPMIFSTEAELKAKVFASEWLSETIEGRKFVVGRTQLTSLGRSRERITCWLIDSSMKRVICLADMRFADLGPVKMKIDKKTSILLVTALADTPFKSKALASVILSALGD